MIILIKRFFLFLIFSFTIYIGNVAMAGSGTQPDEEKISVLYAKSQDPHQPDSVRIEAYLNLVDLLSLESNNSYMGNSARSYFQSALILASKSNLLNHFFEVIDAKGVHYRNEADYTLAMAWHGIELKLSDSLNLISEKIVALNNLGVVHRRMDDYQIGSEYHFKALKLAEETNDISGISIATNGLGNIQYLLDNLDEAMRLFRECLRIEQSVNNLLGIAINLNNIGNVYKKMGNYDRALEYYMLSLEANRAIGSQKGVAICYNDIGNIYRERKEFDKALNYCLLGLELNQSMNDLNYLANSQIKVAELFIDKNEYENALKYLEEALKVSLQTKSKANIKDAYHLMYTIYKNLNRPVLALNYLEKAGQLNDSILNEETRRSILKMQTLFNRERSENQITLLKKQKEISELSSKRQKFITLITGIVLLGVLAAFIVVIYFVRMKTKANKLLKVKNKEIERTQAELKMYADQMEIAKEEAIRSNLLKSQFLANMSHEIRTPMNSVIGFTDILAMIITDPKQLSYLESIRSSGNNLLTLINDILDLSKIEAGKMDVDKGPTRIKTLFAEIRNIFSLQIMEKNIRFSMHLDESVPELVSLSEIRLRQILFNLVGNAIKFTKYGEVKLVTMIEKHDSGDGFDLHLKITDTGIGIPAASREKIFEAFYQESDNLASGSGTGLGLTITKRLIEAMNGTISVSSEFGSGTTFFITFKNVTDKTDEFVTKKNTFKQKLFSEKPVFFLLLSQEQTEDELVSLLRFFDIQIHSFYEMNKLMNLLEYTKPDCIFIEPDGFSEDGIIHVLRNKIPESSSIILIGTAVNPLSQPYFTRYKRFVIPDMTKALLKFVRSIAVELNPESESESNVLPPISKAIRDSVDQLLLARNHAQHTQFMNDSELFVEQVLHFAKHVDNKALLEYGNDLKNYVSTFDIEKINTEMAEFDQLLAQQGLLR